MGFPAETLLTLPENLWYDQPKDNQWMKATTKLSSIDYCFCNNLFRVSKSNDEDKPNDKDKLENSLKEGGSLRKPCQTQYARGVSICIQIESFEYTKMGNFGF